MYRPTRLVPGDLSPDEHRHRLQVVHIDHRRGYAASPTWCPRTGPLGGCVNGLMPALALQAALSPRPSSCGVLSWGGRDSCWRGLAVGGV